MKNALIALIAGLAATTSSHALSVTYSSVPATVIIPNGGAKQFSLSVDNQIAAITDVNVHIVISGGNNLDLAALVFYSDLLDPSGLLIDTGELNDSGLDIWLDDSGADISTFNPGAPAGTRYKPADPLALSIFNGLAANANWYLSLEDGGPLGGTDQEGVFIQWELEITGNTASAVPDSIPYVPAFSLFSMVALDAFRRRFKREA